MGSEPTATMGDEAASHVSPAVEMPMATPRFLLFLAVTVAWFMSFFLLQAALPKYLERHHFSNGRIGLVVGILSVSAVLSRPYLGRAMDRGLLFPLLVASTVMMLSSPLYGIGAALWLLIGVRLFQGVSSGIFMTGGPVFVADLTPPRRLGEAMGLFNVASTVAIAVGPPAGLLIGEHLSYHLTWAMSAGAGGLAALLLLPLRQAPGEPPPALVARAALIEWRVWPAAIPGFIAALGNGTLFAFLVPLMDERHLPGAGFFFTFDACAFFLIRAVGGKWSDRYGRWAVVVPGLAALGLALAVLAAVPVFPAFVFAAFVWGGAISVIIPELTALAVDLVPSARRGAAVATYTGIFEAGIALSGLALGWVADATSLPFIFALAAVLLFLTAAWSWSFSSKRRESRRHEEHERRHGRV